MLEFIELYAGVNQGIESLSYFLWTYILIGMLISLGVYFTIKLRGAQIFYLKEMVSLVSETADPSKLKRRAISSFQALCVSTASRVGVGNIAGIAIAISIGGPGAVFWMWVLALLASASSLIESTLAQIYKVKSPDGFRGGPAYYMKNGLGAKWLGLFFSLLTVFTYGFAFNAVQANTITSVLVPLGVRPFPVALGIALTIGVIVFGGITRIGKISKYLIPFKVSFYLVLALWMFIKYGALIPETIQLIIQNAFGINQVVGAGMSAALMQGIKRGLYSNEAGMGSVPNIAAAAATTHPVKQGLIQTLGVFIDTGLICTSTAFIVLLSGSYLIPGLEGAQIVQHALIKGIGPLGGYFLTFSILLFAFTAMIGNYYYGETNLRFMTHRIRMLTVYRVMVIVVIFFGSLAKLVLVWNLADIFLGLMAGTNLIAITLLGKVAFSAFADYARQKKAGLDPSFKVTSLKESYRKHIVCWDEE